MVFNKIATNSNKEMLEKTLNIFLTTNLIHLPSEFHNIKDLNSLCLWIENMIESDASTYLITKDEDYIGLVIEANFNSSRHIGYIIDRAFQNKGYGSQLLSAIITKAQKEGISSLYAGVNTQNIPSIKILEKNNFTFSNQKDSELIYTLDLTI